MAAVKTNAVRLLEAAGIQFALGEYEVDEENLSGVHAAELIGMPPEQVFKTLVARGDRNGVAVFCIPVAEELDLKRAAAASGNKNLQMVPVRDLLPLTGYVRGGCSPIGMKEHYPTYIDETCILFDRIAVSAGRRGLQLLIAPEDLCEFIGAEQVRLTVS